MIFVDTFEWCPVTFSFSRAALPSLFGTRDQFRERQFFHGRWGSGDSGGDASDGVGMVQAIMRAMGRWFRR